MLADHQGYGEAAEAADHEVGYELDIVFADLLELSVVYAFCEDIFYELDVGGVELVFQIGHNAV